MLDTLLPLDFMQQMRRLLGDEADALFTSICTEPSLRGLRLHRYTFHDSDTTQLTTAGDLDACREKSDSPYAISTRMQVPMAIRRQLGQPIPWLADAFYIQADSTLGKSIYHETGAFYLQEPSAMAVAQALAAKPGERVLDLCAAPGGKTTAIAKAMRGEGTLVANEIHPKRVLALAQNLERLGVPAVVVNESPQHLADSWPGYFDAVLVDAPCSGEGMFRKEPAARSEWTAQAPRVCATRQEDILTAAAKLVRPGGRILYSTCTLNPVENEQLVAWAVQHLPLVLTPLPDWQGWSNGRPDWADDVPGIEHTRRLWPHLGPGEGHFVAAFEVLAQTEELLMDKEVTRRLVQPDAKRVINPTTNRTAKNAAHRPIEHKWRVEANEEWLELADALLSHIPTTWQQVTVQKGSLFTTPPPDLPLDRLRVLRPGMCVAQTVGQRLEPHHSLAMGVHPGLVRTRLELQPEEAAKYMAGLTIDGGDVLGWAWICTSGNAPVGWGKGVPGRVNNAYPRGLRRQGLIVNGV